MPGATPQQGAREAALLVAAVGRMSVVRAHERILSAIHAIRELADKHRQLADELAVQAAAYAAPTMPNEDAIQAAGRLLRALAQDEAALDEQLARADLPGIITALRETASHLAAGTVPSTAEHVDVQTAITGFAHSLSEPMRDLVNPLVQSFASHIGDLSHEQAANAAAIAAAAALATPDVAALNGSVVMLAGFVEEMIGRFKVIVELERPEGEGANVDAVLDQLERSFFFKSVEGRLRRLVDDWDDLAGNGLRPWTLVEELFERRNAIVHRGGQPSSQYRRKIASDDPNALWNRPTDLSYVHHAANATQVFVTWLQVHVCRDHLGLPEAAAQAVIRVSFDLLETEAWSSVVTLMDLCNLPSPDATGDSDLLHINLFTARAHLPGGEGVADEVAAWQPRNPTTRVQLARACLTSDLEKAARLAIQAVDDGELAVGALKRWPAYESLRASDHWDTVLEALS